MISRDTNHFTGTIEVNPLGNKSVEELLGVSTPATLFPINVNDQYEDDNEEVSDISLVNRLQLACPETKNWTPLQAKVVLLFIFLSTSIGYQTGSRSITIEPLKDLYPTHVASYFAKHYRMVLENCKYD